VDGGGVKVWRMTRSEESTLAIQKLVEFGHAGVKELGHVILPNLLRGSPVDRLILPVSPFVTDHVRRSFLQASHAIKTKE
jgi:hypothetical protein